MVNRKVALVLDPDFGEQLIPWAEAMPVWVIGSPCNRLTIDRLRLADALSITTFDAKEAESYELTCERIVHSLDQHHDGYAQSPEYNELNVIGVSLGSILLKGFLELGFDLFEQTPSGFVAKKSKLP